MQISSPSLELQLDKLQYLVAVFLFHIILKMKPWV